MSASDGEIIKKLVSGQRTKNFEELHLLTPGITWSPDGKKIALAVKAGERDAIMIVDVATKDVQEITFDLDGIFSVNWSPNGELLTFVGMKVPQTDIYVYNLKTKELNNLTNDLFTDHYPVFAPDNRTIYFASDRRNFISSALLDPHFKIWQYRLRAVGFIFHRYCHERNEACNGLAEQQRIFSGNFAGWQKTFVHFGSQRHQQYLCERIRIRQHVSHYQFVERIVSIVAFA